MEWLWVVALLAIIVGPLLVGAIAATRQRTMRARRETEDSEELRTIRAMKDMRDQRDRWFRS